MSDSCTIRNTERSIPDGADNRVVAAEVDQARDGVLQFGAMGRYDSVTVMSEGTVNISHASGELSASLVRMRLVWDGLPRVSYILVTGYRNHFVKVRFTVPEEMSAEGEEALEALKAVLSRALSGG